MIYSSLLLLITFYSVGSPEGISSEQIRGVNLVSPVEHMRDDCILPMSDLNANYVSLCPFAFMTPGDPNVYYNTIENYWGDRPSNLALLTMEAKEKGLKVLLKPHFWVTGQGWPGDYNLDEKGWKEWEKNYSAFVVNMARFADSLNIEMYCIGVEFKTAVNLRKGFWPELIKEVRKNYRGKLIYAANWDNYYNISFWDQLDYIGIDAYFPLLNEKTPEKDQLIKKWDQQLKVLEKFSDKYKRPVLFTEYGYRSIDGTAWNQWELEYVNSDKMVNLEAQMNAYAAFYEAVWDEEWFAGGFLWKWYPEYENAGGMADSDYTPQNKPVEKLIKQWYSK